MGRPAPSALTDDFERTGFAAITQVLTSTECADLASRVRLAADDVAGTRGLLEQAWCRDLVRCLRTHPGVAAIVPTDHVAVQCTYFEKSRSRNWLVPVHQDLSIPVAAHVDSDELRAWSEKEGELFVQPPVAVLQSLVALRLHLDGCAAEDGPLQVLPGSHVHGRIEPEAASAMRRQRAVVDCVMAQGDALVLRPLLLHASSKATGNSQRRVLHILFGPPHLPLGLQWRHAV